MRAEAKPPKKSNNTVQGIPNFLGTPKSYKVCVTISTLATSEVTPAMERQAKKRTHRIRPNVPIVEKSTGILKVNNACCVDDEEHKRVYH